MIRALHVIDHLGLGGAQSAVLDLLVNFDPTKVTAEVAVMHGRGIFAEALERNNVPVHSLSPSKFPPLYVPRLLALVESGRFDVLHFHLQASNWLGKPLAAMGGARCLISHDHTSGDLRFRGVGSLIPDALSHKFSSRIIAVSEGVRDFLIQWEGVSPEKIDVISNGVDTAFFRPASPDQKAAARKALQLPEDAFLVGAMGRLAPEKNYAFLASLAALHPDVRFVIAGAGPQEVLLRELGAPLGERFRLLGAVSDRPQFYHALDVFILPSLFEALPMALLEAMASGVPLLASRLEGIAGAVSENREGLLAAPGSLEEFSQKLSLLARDSALRNALARKALDRVCGQYSATRTAQLVEMLYARELSCASSPGC